MKIKLDENLGSRGAEILRAAGYSVTTVVEEGLSAASDDRLIEVCRSERKCPVTLDMDFGNPVRFDPSRHAGIVVLRLPARFTAGDLLDAIRTLVIGLADAAVAGKLWIVQRGRIREYHQE